MTRARQTYASRAAGANPPLSITLPREVLAELDRLCELNDLSRSAVIASLVLRATDERAPSDLP